jgi:hypothetical protein
MKLQDHFQVKRRPPLTQAITAVAIQPIQRRYRGTENLPITFRLEAMIIMITINEAATTPFNTAAQTKAFTGLIWIKSIVRPIRVATVIAA